MIIAGFFVASIHEQINQISRLLPEALIYHRVPGRTELKRLRLALKRNDKEAWIATRCRKLESKLRASAAVRSARQQHRPHLVFDEALPISDRRSEIIAAIAEHPVLIVAGETGSGKTTQLPKLCMAAGRGIDGWIGVTQPRRIAAASVSRRIAQELKEELGQTIGYKIRFQDAVSDRTRVKMMTDGILLAEAHQDPFLNRYDTIIVDEAHERSLNIDFILGILKKLLDRRRDLKVIITSATIDTQKFSEAFDAAPVIQVSGRMYPVETRYMESAQEDITHVEMAVKAVDQLEKKRRRGDILIFMPTEQDIRDTCELLEGRRLRSTRVIPLFARLSATDQQAVFSASPKRKIVVATNVAETSITIPGIRYVIDSGLARTSVYAPRSRTTTLPVRPVSKSSADQRKGRCGRVANGICIRLYSEEDYQGRAEFALPEILRANLADVILRMIALRLGDVDAFPFIDPPAPKSIQDGYQLLEELGAIAPAKRPHKLTGRYGLTPKGRLMARLPLDPRLSCMLLEAGERGCLEDIAVICSALSIQDPRERPAARQAEADRAQARFAVPTSDFVTLVRIWHTYRQVVRRRKSWAEVKTFCRDHFLSFRRMREWQDIYRQIISNLGEHDIAIDKRSVLPDEADCSPQSSWYAAVHQSILCGFLSNIALRKEKQIYQASHNRQVMLFPGSGLFKTPPQWVVAAEMVETSRLFARCAAALDPAWLEPIGRSLCTYSYSDPHWERNRGQVVATEQVSLFGLVIEKRSRPYGPSDPDGATAIFIRAALIEGDVRQPLSFMQHNQRVLARAESMEDRLRRRDIRLDDAALVDFYHRRLGRIYDLRTLKSRIRKRGGDTFLRLDEEQILLNRPDPEELNQFPDTIAVNQHEMACQYRFAPGKPKDGITVRVPVAIAASLDADPFEWLVPGLLKEKIAALVKGLPKTYRRRLVPVAKTVEMISAEMPMSTDISLATALSRFIDQRFGVQIPAAAWRDAEVPSHLRMRIALADSDGQIIRSSRNPAVLKAIRPADAVSEAFETARKGWERAPIETWNFGDLADSILLEGDHGSQWTAYPSLEERAGQVVLTAHAQRARAKKTHPLGVRALYLRQFAADVKFLKKNLSLPPAVEAPGRYFGGRKKVEAQLFEKVIDDLFLKSHRSSAAFQADAIALRKEGLAGQGQDLRQRIIELLFTYAEVRRKLHDIGQAHPNSRPIGEFLNQLLTQLNRLVPETFVRLYDENRLSCLIRYLEAIAVRAERGLLNLEKDRTKTAQIAPFERQLNDMLRDLETGGSRQRREAIEIFFWMLEEFRISIFAPEIKPNQPISSKKLKAQINRIASMA